MNTATLYLILTTDIRDRNYPGTRELASRNFIWYTDGVWRVTGRGAVEAALHGYPLTHRVVPRPSASLRGLRGSTSLPFIDVE